MSVRTRSVFGTPPNRPLWSEFFTECASALTVHATSPVVKDDSREMLIELDAEGVPSSLRQENTVYFGPSITWELRSSFLLNQGWTVH